MAKIMLVEDDNNLREIYEARLLAEGFEIVSAQDGEVALALAVKEKPDLIVCDVMMPKISGFDMLDILRSTDGIKDTKVIMMTALSQAEDKVRAEKLGADRYLVKSQVTLEDMAKVVHEVLGDESVANQLSPNVSVPTQEHQTTSATQVTPATTTPAQPVIAPISMATPSPSGQALTTPPAAPSPIAPAQNPASSDTPPSNIGNPPTVQTPLVNPSDSADPAVPTLDGPTAPTTPEPPKAEALVQDNIHPSESTVPANEKLTPTPTDTPSSPQDIDKALKALSEPAKSEEVVMQNQINEFIAQQETSSTDGEAANAPDKPSTPPTDQPVVAQTTNATDQNDDNQTSAGAGSDNQPPQKDDEPEMEVSEPHDSVTVSGKKVIRPLSDPIEKPDLNELLAKEAALQKPSDEIVVSDPEDRPSTTPNSVTPNNSDHMPGKVVSPSSGGAGENFDPHGIAL